MSGGHLIKRWRIRFQNGFAIECYRRYKPTRLADSWAKVELPFGRFYGAYTIECQGLFDKQLVG